MKKTNKIVKLFSFFALSSLTASVILPLAHSAKQNENLILSRDLNENNKLFNNLKKEIQIQNIDKINNSIDFSISSKDIFKNLLSTNSIEQNDDWNISFDKITNTFSILDKKENKKYKYKLSEKNNIFYLENEKEKINLNDLYQKMFSEKNKTAAIAAILNPAFLHLAYASATAIIVVALPIIIEVFHRILESVVEIVSNFWSWFTNTITFRTIEKIEKKEIHSLKLDITIGDEAIKTRVIKVADIKEFNAKYNSKNKFRLVFLKNNNLYVSAITISEIEAISIILHKLILGNN